MFIRPKIMITKQCTAIYNFRENNDLYNCIKALLKLFLSLKSKDSIACTYSCSITDNTVIYNPRKVL